MRPVAHEIEWSTDSLEMEDACPMTGWDETELWLLIGWLASHVLEYCAVFGWSDSHGVEPRPAVGAADHPLLSLVLDDVLLDNIYHFCNISSCHNSDCSPTCCLWCGQERKSQWSHSSDWQMLMTDVCS